MAAVRRLLAGCLVGWCAALLLGARWVGAAAAGPAPRRRTPAERAVARFAGGRGTGGDRRAIISRWRVVRGDDEEDAIE